MQAQGKLDVIQEEFHLAQEQWRDAYTTTLQWVGRVSFGFGVGDKPPAREEVRPDGTVKGRVDPKTAIEEMLKNVVAGNR